MVRCRHPCGVVFSFLLIPAFSYGLYTGATAVRDAAIEWIPNRRLWRGVALLHLLAVFVVPTFVTIPA